MNILPIVEGQSDVEAIPIIIRRILHANSIFDIKVLTPFRIKRNKVVLVGQLEKAIKIGLYDRENVCAVILILDADEDCPIELSKELSERVENYNYPISVVLAKRELECWFLGAKESLRGIRGIRSDAHSPDNPEDMDGKGGIKRNMIKSRCYIEVDDAPAFAEKFDMEMARKKCPSFDKFVREVNRLVDACKDM